MKKMSAKNNQQKTLKTRTKYRIVGSDYSAQERA